VAKPGRITTDLTGSNVLGMGADVAAGVIIPMLSTSGNQRPGWRNESYRHSLAARGISTTIDMGAKGVHRQTPDFLVRREIVHATRIPRDWKITRAGFTGDHLTNDRFRYEVWSTEFRNARDSDVARYYYIIRLINRGNDRFGDPVVEDRAGSYDAALQWLEENKTGEFHRGERP
jgi:hypothetical protein